jgi:hypothetical protein
MKRRDTIGLFATFPENGKVANSPMRMVRLAHDPVFLSSSEGRVKRDFKSNQEETKDLLWRKPTRTI